MNKAGGTWTVLFSRASLAAALLAVPRAAGSVSRRFLSLRILTAALLALFLAAPATVFAAGGSESGFSDWYGSLNEMVQPENTANTGLTAFPTLLIPMGGEHEAMGTAYTAVGRDLSFLESNPAASASLNETEVSVYHTNLIADTNMEAVGFTSRREDLGYGFAVKHLHVPFTGYDDFGVQTSTSRYSETIAAANISYNFFRNFYFDGLSVGSNLKAGYRYISESVAPGQSAAAVMADVGLLTRFHFLKFYSSRFTNFSLGTTVQNLGPPALGDPLPTRWTTGLAWSPIRPLLLAADYTVPFSADFSTPAPAPSYAVGMAVTVTEFLSIRSGFNQRGGNPRFTLGGSMDMERMSISVNYTLDLTTQLSAFDRFSVHAGFRLGDQGRADRQDRVREYYLDALQAFATGELEATIELTRRILAIDPTFVPAEETLAMAGRMLDLQRQMESIRLGADDEEVLSPDE